MAPPLTCTLRKVTIPFREPSERAPPERIGHFPSSVSSSRGCAGVCHKCTATLEKKKKGKEKKKNNQKSQNSFVSFTSSSFLPPPPTFPLSLSLLFLPLAGCEYPASEKSDQTDSQGSVSQRHRGCQSMLVPSCPTMHRARPTLLLLPLLLTLGLLLHLADAQSKCARQPAWASRHARPPPTSLVGRTQGR